MGKNRNSNINLLQETMKRPWLTWFLYIKQVCEEPIVTSDAATLIVPRKQANIRDVSCLESMGKATKCTTLLILRGKPTNISDVTSMLDIGTQHMQKHSCTHLNTYSLYSHIFTCEHTYDTHKPTYTLTEI